MYFLGMKHGLGYHLEPNSQLNGPCLAFMSTSLKSEHLNNVLLLHSLKKQQCPIPYTQMYLALCKNFSRVLPIGINLFIILYNCLEKKLSLLSKASTGY